ncbi:hypothetical protein DYB30_004945 [Aphanomyces astaci]|uniref:Uncharacterized protein n=1 Tax=Aphanomyces astaci TaxID=112090 RepID=A0A397D3D9_APHAT|nr:hypothetical protein DYB30_004945 [Aphanomyces astaci]
MYRDTTPHAGYEILQRWKARVMAKSGVASHDDNSSASTTTPDPFFSFTSNVDAHFLKFFQPNEVYEIHGNTEALSADSSKRLVILEIGCGTRVCAIGTHSKRAGSAVHAENDQKPHPPCYTGDYQAHLIRVNPDMEDDEFEWQGSDGHQLPPMTKIEGFGLATLLAIDQEIVGSDA